MEALFNEDYLIREEHYQETMEKEVLPFLQAREQVLTVNGEEGKPLYAVAYKADAPIGSVQMVHGFTENAYKYSELIHSFLRNGLNVVMYDQRGHGRSWRSEDISDPSLTHVDRFDEYVRDMEAVIAQALTGFPKPWMVFCHSMGGAVTALYLEQHPDTFTRAVFCAPMIAPNLGGIPAAAIGAVCRCAKAVGNGKKRVFISKPYAGPEDFETSAASGKVRFAWYNQIKDTHKEFQNNGPTYCWTLEAVNVTKRILAPGAVERITCPARVYGAENDGSVMGEPQASFAARLKNGSRTVVPGSRHEIYRSPDAVLFPWWHEILTFIKG